MTVFFANIGYFYLALYFVTVAFCVWMQTNTALNSAISLGAIVYPAWDPVSWGSPENMAYYHLAIVIGICLFFPGYVGLMLACLTLLMVIVDMVYVLAPGPGFGAMDSDFPFGLFWWQSILNIIYLLQVTILLFGGYTYHKNHRNEPRKGSKYGSFWAFIGLGKKGI